MKYCILVICFFLVSGCILNQDGQAVNKKQAQILPIEITISGQLQEVKDVGLLIPNIRFSINEEQVKMTVGANEQYYIEYSETTLNDIFKQFELEDFRSNETYFNPNLEYMGYMETEKEIKGRSYLRKFSNFKRRDIEVNYLELSAEESHRFSALSNYLNELAIALLQEDIEESMISATTMAEALSNPTLVYKLTLRNTPTTSLPPEIGTLTNLRVLDISGTRIKQLPEEIGKCIHLKSIIANASRLEGLPSSIGNLKKLRNLNVGYCRIASIPEEIGEITSLWTLGLGSNQLHTLPESMENLKNLQMLRIDNNNFSQFPEAVLGLECVGNLWMHGNSFQEIPVDIVKLRSLHHFLVDAHEINNMEEIRSLIPDVRIIDEIKRN